MKNLIFPLSLVASAAVGAMAAELKIEVTQAVDCDRKTKKGDAVEMHYKGTLAANGNKFDASYDRNVPFKFNLGTGQVIAGWDEGLLDMSRTRSNIAYSTLTIPPEKGYGQRNMGPIPAGSTLVFETELLGIKGVPKPESIKYKSASSTASSAASDASSTASEAAETASEKATGGVKEAVASAASAAADAAGTMLVDTDDVQEHNEL
ncbi:fkbp-type peptidyl-prolyl [Apiospora aurea]|uniref:peptidylprolyl isomerase n=1 Tax=Apiospora aurea TaxID=335848 RepID=A0ABR1QPM8_9PEZI